jgi:GNAT superfamily N-acetyltransferase
VNRTLVGSPVDLALLRHAGPADAADIREFVCGLSPRTQQLRFFACVAPPSTGLLAALCGTTGRADILVAANSHGMVIAHGMAADAAAGDGLESSIGLVVADSWQRRGLGTQLMAAVIGRAARRGVGSLVLEVLPDNHVMLGIIGRRWPDAPVERTPDALIFRPSISVSQRQPWLPATLRLRQPGHRGDQRAPSQSAA